MSTHLLIRAYSYLMVLFDNFGFRKSSTVAVDPAKDRRGAFQQISGDYSRLLARAAKRFHRKVATDRLQRNE
jgi:hypothetical protein